MAPKSSKNSSSAEKKSFAAQYDEFVEKKYIPQKKNVKIAVAAGIVIAMLAAFYFLVYTPKTEEIDKLTATQKKLQEEVGKAEEASSKKNQHEQELAETKKKFEEISKLLPKGKEIPDLLTNISDLGKRAGLDFVSFKPGNDVPKDFYAEIPISIELLGPYHNIGYFLGEVSGLERLVTVDNIKMGNPKETEGEILLKSSCNLLTYRQQEPSEAKPDDKKKKKK
ncbi:Pilus assembly protein PilO [Candidatus Electronema halotolerans]